MSDRSGTTIRSVIASVPNLRDIGGYVTADGHHIREGVLYRSEQLSHVSGTDEPKYDSLGLKKIFDLRTEAERTAQADEVPPGARYVVEDVLADAKGAAPAQLLQLLNDPAKANAALGGGKIVQMFTKSYAELISLPSARAGFGDMFSELSDESNLPALFHCTTGKDRTGWAAAALLTLCGVSAEDVMADYLRSNDYILPEYQAMIDKYAGAGVDKDILLSILGVRHEYLDASFKEMEDTYGSIENYFADGLGMDEAGQQDLRARFLV